jgi:hypothetical protein
MSQSNKTDHYIAPYDDSVSFDELPDSAPSSRYSPSWTGWLGISVVSFWVFIAILGPYIAPLGENDRNFLCGHFAGLLHRRGDGYRRGDLDPAGRHDRQPHQ